MKQIAPEQECNYQKINDWSIHGIWQARKHSFAPKYCNNSSELNFNNIKSIIPELKIKWFNTHKGLNFGELWIHEWTKHGTCLIDNQQLNTQFKYFNKGIDLHKKYNLKNIFKKVNILPGEEYYVNTLYENLKIILQVDPEISCVKNEVKNLI